MVVAIAITGFKSLSKYTIRELCKYFVQRVYNGMHLFSFTSEHYINVCAGSLYL